MKTVLEFYLNGKRQVVRDADPTQTILEFVRSRGLTGTKLGCSEGGCGACTIDLSFWQDDREHHKAVNGCLVPIIAVDGKHVVTIEGIGNTETPHAAQERIAKYHGSQCGFCTPGIVMSLYALLRESRGKPTEQQVSEAFDGNLCRCTGYKPIIDAAHTFVDANCCGKSNNGSCCKTLSADSELREKDLDHSSKSRPFADCCKSKEVGGVCCRTQSLTTPNGLELRPYPHTELIFPPPLRKYKPELLKIEHKGVTWFRPTTKAELSQILEDYPNAHMVAGASEFQIEAKIKGDEHDVAVYVLDIPELQIFEYIPGHGIRIGANISLSTLEHHLESLVNTLPRTKTQWYAAILEQLKYFAGRQVRNAATPAGNISTASPISDLNPIFAAANAKLHISTGITLEMGSSADPFFIGYRKTRLPPSSFIEVIEVRESVEGEIVRSYKQAKRKDDDISIVTACMSAIVNEGLVKECSLGFGGVALFTVLSKAAQKLVGCSVSDVLESGLNALDKEFQLPYNVPGGMAVYRRSLILSFFYKFVQSVLVELTEAADNAALDEVTRASRPIGVRDLHNPYEEDLIGKSLPHASAMKQVTGEATYVDDIRLTVGELHGVQVMSTIARGKILSVDWSRIYDVEGVEGYVDHKDVPGSNTWGFPTGPDHLFADKQVDFVGDCIGLVLATTREAAVKGARLVKVEYEPEAPIITIEQAIEAGSFFDVHPEVKRGSFEKEWESAPHKFEGQCRMGAQEHFYLETQGCIVYPEDNDEFKIVSSTQNPNETQLVAAAALALPANRIVVKAKRLGGGFGGKESRSVHYSTIATVAARKFRCPVRLMLTRAEDMLQAGQRHPFLSKWRVTMDESFKFTGLQVRLYANAGYSMDLTKGVIDRAVLHVDNCYNFGPNIDVSALACKTNIASNTAFRGFGGPQGMFVAESIIYEVSESLGIEPEALRKINYYPEVGGVTHYGQRIGKDFTASIMAKKLLEDVKYDDIRRECDVFNSKSKWVKRGLAHVPTKFGVSFGVQWLNQAGALVHIYEDGSVLLAHGGTEMGQGLHTKMTMIAAAELGVPYESVYISETNTQVVANASPTAASASSDLNGMAVKNACDQLNERLEPYRQKFGKAAPLSKIAHAAYFDRVNLSANGYYKTPDIGYVWGDKNSDPAFFYYTQGSCVALVEANMLTGDWSCLRADIIMDIGRPINQAIDYGQIEGAFVQGMGLFTLEESLWAQSGALITRGPGAYKIPGFRDIPQHFNVRHLADRPFDHLRTIRRSKGIGEPPLFLGSAVMFAIRDAIKTTRYSHGLFLERGIEAPLTTERIRIAGGDSLVKSAEVEIIGKPFAIRS